MEVHIISAFIGVDADHHRTIAHLIKLTAVTTISDYHPRCRLMQTVLDGFRTKSGEQRLIDRPQPPTGQHCDQQFGNPWQETGNAVPRPHTLCPQDIGKTCSQSLQLFETVLSVRTLTALPVQSDLVTAHMAIAALNTGIECREVTMQVCAGHPQIVETARGVGIITHRQTPGSYCWSSTMNLTIVAPESLRDNGQSCQTG
ncbi:hypothetical protein D3C79_717080 [compost metagenome]